MRNSAKLLTLALALLAVPADAGRSRGRATHYDVVDANSTDSYRERFDARQTAIVSVRGDGSTDLDCYVYDENDNLVDDDTDSTDTCALLWRPVWTGAFTIKIRNRGSVPNAYRLETN